MAEFLTFSEAARQAGVSRQRLNRAIHLGHLPAQRGGGPGKPTRICLEDLQAWCAREGLAVPVAPSERSDQTPALVAQPDVAALMEHLERTVEQTIARAVAQVVDQVVERLIAHLEHAARAEHDERLEHPGRTRHAEHAERSTPAGPPAKAALLKRLREMKAAGLSLQAMADRLTAEGVLTLTGKKTWHKGPIGNLPAQTEEGTDG
jgi:excisionase family DNA binding protein